MGNLLRERLKKGGAALIILAYLAFLYFPIYWLVTMSLKVRVDIMAIPPKWTFKPILDNYQWLLSRSAMLGSISRSLVVTVLVVFFALLFGVPAAYVLSRFEFRRKQDLEFWVFSTRFMPAVAVIIPFYYLWLNLKLLDSTFSLVVTYLSVNLPLVIWLMAGFFRGIPLEYDESARTEGATLMQSFWKVVLPLARPGMTAAAILVFLFTWNDFFFAFILTSRNPTLPVTMGSFIAQGLEVRYGEMAAAGVIASIPSIIFAIVARKGLISGFRSIAGLSGGGK